eukprot:scaffold11394_cov183-Amphora_coffeaeformis.AAC.7
MSCSNVRTTLPSTQEESVERIKLGWRAMVWCHPLLHSHHCDDVDVHDSDGSRYCMVGGGVWLGRRETPLSNEYQPYYGNSPILCKCFLVSFEYLRADQSSSAGDFTDYPLQSSTCSACPPQHHCYGSSRESDVLDDDVR